MKVLHVNNVDLPGRRFNGYDLLGDLRERGVTGKQAVKTKLSGNPDVVQLMDPSRDDPLEVALRRVERRHSMNNMLFPWGRLIEQMPEFQDADVVHYHLLHNEVASLIDLPRLFRAKPSVWTLHDPWPVTGHCIYPRDCGGWLTGCRECPHLDWTFPMVDDCAGRMWLVKQQIYAQLDADLVVASDFMLDLVTRSPLTAQFERVHKIPFGIKRDGFMPSSAKSQSRAALGIPRDDFVLFFRSTESAVKGVDLLVDALAMRPPSRSVTLLTVDQKGLLAELRGQYNVVEFGWVEDPTVYPRIFSACDVFVMPSIAEAFGLMALEAMASSRPVICLEGTSLPQVTNAPSCGLAVPQGDVGALRDAIDFLAANPIEVERRGDAGCRLVAERYDYDRYLDSLVALYEDARTRQRSAVVLGGRSSKCDAAGEWQ